MSNYDNFKARVASKNTINESVREILNAISEHVSTVISDDEGGMGDNEKLIELQSWLDKDRAGLVDAVLSNTHEGNAAMSLAKQKDRASAPDLMAPEGQTQSPRKDLRAPPASPLASPLADKNKNTPSSNTPSSNTSSSKDFRSNLHNKLQANK